MKTIVPLYESQGVKGDFNIALFDEYLWQITIELALNSFLNIVTVNVIVQMVIFTCEVHRGCLDLKCLN